MTMPVMHIADVDMLMLDRCMLMLMGVPVSPLRVGCALVIPRVVVAVVGVTAGWIVPVTVGMAERLMAMA